MAKSPKLIPAEPARSMVPRQLNIAFNSSQLRGMSRSERAKAITCLASFLMQAAGIVARERDDEQH
jgi:hypothetical protein